MSAKEVVRWETLRLEIPAKHVDNLKACFARKPRVGAHVDSIDNDYGPGRLQRVVGSRAFVEYFTSPTAELRVEELDVRSVWPAPSYEQTRVYFRDEKARWRVGRLVSSDERECCVRLPNKVTARVPVGQVFLRWRCPIDDPTDWLAAGITETPFWHLARASFVRFAIEQRATFQGLTALASASISLHRHQFEVVHHVLRDPVQRYVLADEVGLGKTIEAGIIIRQYLLDEPKHARVLVVAPTHLVAQWRDELAGRLNLRNDLDARVHVVAQSDIGSLTEAQRDVGMLVVDEAHQLARDAIRREGPVTGEYRAIERLSTRVPRVLLLSATPLLHNEDGFLAMLHLLDPGVYLLTERVRFRELVAQREQVASTVQKLQDDVPETFLDEALDELRGMADDPRLQTLCDTARALCSRDPDDSARIDAVRALRTHLTETHRIDRRVIRTRRESPTVAPDLPQRMGALRDVVPCPVRAAAWQLVEAWRLRAGYATQGSPGHVAEAEAILVGFVGAALSHPLALRDEALRRRTELTNGARPAFTDERTWLDDHLAGIGAVADGDPRVQRVLACVAGLHAARLRSVVFVDDPRAADAVSRALEARYPGRIQRAPLDPTHQGECVAVVCGHDAEEGINLHQVRAGLVHYDLPMAPARIEQRTGRVDRIGSRNTNIISHLLLSEEPWELAWADLLDAGTRVFARSIAPLQYVLEDQMRVCFRELFNEGHEAFRSAVARMQAHATGLDAELGRIHAQEMLDAFEVHDDDRFAVLEEGDEGDPEADDPVQGWAEGGLQFAMRRQDGGKSLRYRYSLGDAKWPTLLTVGDLAGPLRFAIERTTHHAACQTELSTLDRDHAARSRLPLLRIGHPFVDGLMELARYDDRGVAWAFWRAMPNRPRTPEVFFRFDFVVTLDDDEATALIRAQGGSTHAVHRRADEAFPPIFRTVWTDRDGTPITNPTSELTSPYQKSNDTWRDFNLNPDRWARLDERGLIPGWERACERARARAEVHLRHETTLDTICRQRIDTLERQHAVTAQRLQSRRDRLVNSHTAEYESLLLIREEQLFEKLCRGIRSPAIRPDSAGAVILAGDHPFGGAESE